MAENALSAGLCGLGVRMVVLLVGHYVQFNLGPYNHVAAPKRRQVVPLGCGCMTWMDKGGSEGCVL